MFLFVRSSCGPIDPIEPMETSSSSSIVESPRYKSPGSGSLRRNSVSSRRSSSFAGHGRYSDQLTPEFDPSTYSAGQSLASILNNPITSSDSSWANWFFAADSSLETVPPTPTKALPEISKAEFRGYLDSISEAYGRFVDVQEHSCLEEEESQSSSNEGKPTGEGLAACLREIPALYFEEDFALEKGSTFQAACPFSTIPQNVMLQEKLSQYLDVVEVHLVKEISARSESFFEAQRQLEGLNGKVLEACKQVAELKATVQLLDHDLVDSAAQVHARSAQRDNLLALHDKLKLMTYVNQAVSALRILVSAADCAGALDVIDELQHLLEGDELVGMHCFRHLADQLASSTEAVNGVLAADFVRAAIHDSKDLESSEIASSLMLKDKLYAISTEVKVEEEEETNLREQLVPLVIGLLRTSKLPGVLRVYKDTLTTDLKTAIKTVVAEALPVLLARTVDDVSVPDGQTELEVGGLSLADKLRSLTPDNFVQLLVTVFKTIQTRLVRAAKVRHIIEEIISGLQGSYAAAAIAAAFASGAAAVAAAEAAQEQQQTSLPVLAQSLTNNDPLVAKGSRGAQLSNISKQFRADVLRENTEALWAACDAAHGRWGKLLGVRAPVHSKLRLQEFVNIYNVTQEFIAATEKVGGRLGYTIRGTLQSQSKSFVDAQHSARVPKITAVLDQETWLAADVPDEFQDMVDKLQGITDSVQSNGEAPGDPVSNGQEVHATGNNEVLVSTAKRPRVKTIRIQNTGYHLVNSGLILLKVISEYVDICNALPALATEAVHRLAEILKVFNSRSCQLVLGAGALQVSGLKSITAKHLALASQTISFLQILIPGFKRTLFVYIPEARQALLGSELDRVAQDYKVHRDEIHTKLVQIMTERLTVHLKILPQVVEGWNKSDESSTEPSQFAKSLTKEVGVLHKILSPLLLDEDMISIFTRVVAIFHSRLSEVFVSLDVPTAQANQSLYVDVRHILACIHGLPSETVEAGELDVFVEQRFGN